MEIPIRKRSTVAANQVVLKPYSTRDLETLAGFLTNAEITKTFMVPDFASPDQALALAEKLIAFSQISDTRHWEYGVYLDDRLIGFVNDCGIAGDEIEVGYVIHPDYQGHGYATDALRATIQELRAMGFRKVTAGFFEGNTASRRVMEKCSMTLCDWVEEEEYRGRIHKCLYYEIHLL